jgi:hypothetical protein
MTSSITTLAATEHIADLQRIADSRRVIPSGPQSIVSAPANAPAVAVRLADAAEDRMVRDLAALDSAQDLKGPVLLALIDGQPAAGLSLLDARVVANPFIRTDAAVAQLRRRAKHLSGRRARRRWPSILRPRFA